MKKILVLLLLVMFGITSNAFADKTVTCKTGTGSTFTVVVPDGWVSQPVEGGCVIAKNDKSKHFISISYYKNNKLNAKQFAELLCKTLNVTPKYLTHEDSYTSMLVKRDGLEVRIGIAGEGEGKDEVVQVVTQYPEESEELDKIFDSVN